MFVEITIHRTNGAVFEIVVELSLVRRAIVWNAVFGALSLSHLLSSQHERLGSDRFAWESRHVTRRPQELESPPPQFGPDGTAAGPTRTVAFGVGR